MSKTINLGRVTAYADAVAAGYTGTREQFAHDLANAANYAAEAGDAAETATEAATTASTAAETATGAAEEASADAEQAHADAQAILGAKETAVAAAATAASKAGEAANSAQQAAASETAAAGSATTASNAATSATASKNAAATSETNAANSSAAAAQTLTNVNQAGATQVAAIQAKGIQVLNSIPADYTELSNDVDALKSDLSDIFDLEFERVNVAEITDATELTGVSFGVSASYPNYVLGSDNSGFDSYYFYGNDGEEIYFESVAPTSPAYIAVTYGTNPSKQWVTIAGNANSMLCNSSARIRKSDNDLPTETNKLNISNCIVCITVTAGTTCEFYINRKKILNGDIELSNSQIEQVISAIPEETTKTCKVQYVTPSMSYSSEQLNIYIPQKTGYVLYKFTRTTIASINADVWRIDQIESVSDDFSLRFPITYGGEIEFALRLQGRSDFSGGRAHGDEVVTEVEFWVDGAVLSPESLTTLTDFTVLKCCEVTNVYDPNDSTTIVATHGREYVFDENGFNLSQTLEWVAVVPVTQLYMAMYTPRKTYDDLVVTDKAIFDTDFAVFTPTNPVTSTNFSGAKSVMLYSSASGHYSGFELKQYPTGYTGGDLLNISDNGGNNYNKIYAPVITSLSNPVNSVVGDRLKSVAHYFVRVG